MISSKNSFNIVLFTFVFFALVVTSEAMASRKGKTEKAETSAGAEKTESAPAPAPAQVPGYKLTPEEKKTVAEAEEEFKKAKGQAKPSKHMKDKMQSGM